MKICKTVLAASIVAALGVSGSVWAQAAADAQSQNQNAEASDETKGDDGKEAATTLDMVKVVGIRRSLQKSMQIKRDSNAVVDVITAEDVGKFPDKNVAEALARVPGLAINREFGEGERAGIRGLAPNLTASQINGHNVATADWFILDQLNATRTFNYLNLPSEVIGTVEVYKSSRADIEEGGVGGTVIVHTRNPLDLDPNTIQLAALAAYTETSDQTDPQFSGLYSWKNTDQTLGVLLSGVYQERNLRRDGIEILGFFDQPLPDGSTVSIPSLIGSPLFEQERIRKGGNLAVQFKPSDQLEFNLTGFYSRLEADNFNQNFLAWPSNALGGGGTLSNAVIENGTVVAGTIASAADGTAGRGAVFDAIARDAHSQSYFGDLETTFTPNEKWVFKTRIGYTRAEGDTTKQPFVEFGAPASFDFDLRGIPKLSFTNLDPTDPSQVTFDFASRHKVTNNDDELYTYFDGERFFDDGGPFSSVKFGFKHTNHDRSATFDATTYGGFVDPLLLLQGCNGGPCQASDFATGRTTPGDFLEHIAVPGTFNDFFTIDPRLVEQILSAVPGAEENRIPLPSDEFFVEEKTYGGYVMGNLDGENWRGNIGARIVYTKQISTGNEFGAAGEVQNAFGNFTPVTFGRNYTDVLPSANLIYDVAPDVVVRFAAARVITRPDFTDIVPRVSLNPGALSGQGGNPGIDPFRANQYDFSFEWYASDDMSFAVDFFYKDVKSFITNAPETGIFPVQTATPNLARCTPSADVTTENLFDCEFTIVRRANGGGGEIKGVEAQAIIPIWGDFGFQGNFTYTDADADDAGVTIPGSSKYLTNLTAFYDDGRFSGRVSFNRRSSFFLTFDRGSAVSQKALESFDVSFNYNLTKNIALTLEGVNLTNDKIVQFNNVGVPTAIYDNGRYFFSGVRLKF